MEQVAVAEIKREPIRMSQPDGDFIIFDENHSHRDVLRYVISDIGYDETLYHVNDLKADFENDGTNENINRVD